MRVLIVEPDAAGRHAIRRLIQRAYPKASISEAPTALEAARLPDAPFDCILLGNVGPDDALLSFQIPWVRLHPEAPALTDLTPDLLKQTVDTAIRVYRAEDALRRLGLRQALLLETQQEIARVERDLDPVLDVVVRNAQRMTEADGAVVELADGEDMVYRAASGTAAAHLGLRLRRETSLSGRCVAEGRLIVCMDSETDDRVDREACRRIGVRSMVVVPLQYLGRTVGVLKVYSARPHAFPEGDLPLLEMMVSLIVAALSSVAEAEARRALAVSEAWERFSAESAGIGTWHWNLQTGSLVWSDRCKELFGLPADAAMSRERFYECIHPDDRAATQSAINTALSEEREYDVEYRVVHPDGSIHWLASKGRGYFDARGRPLGFEGVVLDIDDRKRAAEQQKGFLRDVLFSVTEGKLLLSTTPAQLPPLLTPFGGPISLTASGGLSALRRVTQEAARQTGHPDERQYDLITAVSEAGMNAVVHGGEGEAVISVSDQGVIQVRVQDHGTGIAMENLPKAALARGFSTKASLGHGLKMMLDLADRFYLLTGPTGTTVVLEQERVQPLPAWLSEKLETGVERPGGLAPAA